MEKNRFDRWDIPGIVGALVSLVALFRGHTPDLATNVQGSETPQKIVSGLKAAFSKQDEGIWISLMASLEAKEQDAITLVLEKLTGLNEVDSFRLAIVNAPNETKTEETRDSAKPDAVIKKVVYVPKFSDEDNRVKLLKKIAARNTEAAIRFVRTHHLAVENPVTKYGPALLDQLAAAIPVRDIEREGHEWEDTLRHIPEVLKRVPIAVWLMGGCTVLGIIAIAIKIHFFD